MKDGTSPLRDIGARHLALVSSIGDRAGCHGANCCQKGCTCRDSESTCAVRACVPYTCMLMTLAREVGAAAGSEVGGHGDRRRQGQSGQERPVGAAAVSSCCGLRVARHAACVRQLSSRGAAPFSCVCGRVCTPWPQRCTRRRKALQGVDPGEPLGPSHCTGWCQRPRAQLCRPRVRSHDFACSQLVGGLSPGAQIAASQPIMQGRQGACARGLAAQRGVPGGVASGTQ